MGEIVVGIIETNYDLRIRSTEHGEIQGTVL